MLPPLCQSLCCLHHGAHVLSRRVARVHLAGIEEVAILVQSRDMPLFDALFNEPPAIENFNKLSRENQEYCDYLKELGKRITFLPQEAQEGFGHAVNCAKEWVGDEPFLLLLGDHIYASHTQTSCAAQLVECYKQLGTSVLGLRTVPGNLVHHFGCVEGRWQEESKLLTVNTIIEKPNQEEAFNRLRVDAVPEDHYLAAFGQYVLTPKIFEYLSDNIIHNVRENGEFQLTSCLDQLRREEGLFGVMLDGESYDIGNPAALLRALGALHDCRSSETLQQE